LKRLDLANERATGRRRARGHTGTMQIQIDNEYDKLEAVLVNRPGHEIERLTHENMRRFLFEDVPYLRRLQDEHDAFVEAMRAHDVTVYYLRDLLTEVLAKEPVRAELMERVCRAAGVPAIFEDLTGLKHWSLDETVDVLFAGITGAEFHERSGRRIATDSDEPNFLLPPIPNAYFSRDPAVVVRDAVISSKMHYRERVRETLLVRAVLENHHEFMENAITYGGTSEPTEDRPYTIEGGDVIILSKDAVLIGASERTRSETIELLADKCFRFGRVQRVYEIAIPAERSFMHLDTVFTVVDRGMVLWFAEVMENIARMHRYEPVETDDGIAAKRVTEERSFLDILAEEFDKEVTIIDTAGGHKHYASREQRSDATNALALAPRLAVTYDRNERTMAALEDHGVTCVGIDDSELVRGLGGPRCMTMPLRRVAPKSTT